jgi:hypothetical protein
MQELINRTSSVAEDVISSAMSVAHLASLFGFSYIAMTVLTSFLTRLAPAMSQRGLQP